MNDNKEKLTWRLSEKLSVSSITSLVDKGILSKEEAKSILFNTIDDKQFETENKALKEQIAFYEKTISGLVDKLRPGTTYTLTTYPHYANQWFTAGTVLPTYVSMSNGATTFSTSGTYAYRSEQEKAIDC